MVIQFQERPLGRPRSKAILMFATAWAALSTAVPAQDRADNVVVDTPPAIVSRQDWQAKPPLPGMKEQKVTGIVLHHTATQKNPKVSVEKKMQGLQTFSQRPGGLSTITKPIWPDVPYHFYVDSTGRIAEGRDVYFAGDTNTNYNTEGLIQIAIEGNFEKERPDPAQLASLGDLLRWLLQSWSLTPDAISLHKDHAPTACPGRYFVEIFPSLLSKIHANYGCSRDSFPPQGQCARTPRI